MDFDCVVDVSWHLYVVRCRGGELYTGIATDVVRRLSEHESGAGAKYLRGKGPLALVFSTKIGKRDRALRVEHAFKRLPKQRKESVVAGRSSIEPLLSRKRT
jgi:putative endonuclease